MANKVYSILVLTGFYLPGFKGGGPIRTLVNLVDQLGDEFDFKIITSDRDLDDTTAYDNIMVDDWNRVGSADVFYMSPAIRSLGGFKKILCSAEYDVLYLNSFFSPLFTIKPLVLRRLGLIPNKPIILAPWGEFSQGALGLKRFKKNTYISMAQVMGLYKDCTWQASSEHEEADIRKLFGNKVNVMIAPNLPPFINIEDKPKQALNKTNGHLKIIFLSRISKKKNLDGALKMLAGLKGEIEFNIYGPIEDNGYWAECQMIIDTLPDNINVRYCSSVEHNEVAVVMKEHDLFFFPTLGENFGHVILEALLAGCPVLISDQTPWRGLEEKNIGWDLPLSKPNMFQKVLQRCVDMDNEEYVQWSETARVYGRGVTMDDGVVEQNRQIFAAAMIKEK